LDFEFLRCLNQYANPKRGDFEEVPLVVTNRAVAQRHVWARLLDLLAQRGDERESEVRVSDLRALRVESLSWAGTLADSPEQFAEALFDEIFPSGDDASYWKWLRREASLVPGSSGPDFVMADLREWWASKCLRLHRRLCERDDVDGQAPLSGIEPFDPDLVPSLRDIGAEVGLFWNEPGNGDKPLPSASTQVGQPEARAADVVSRHTAISSCAPGAYVAQGESSFRISGIRQEDEEAVVTFRDLLRRAQGTDGGNKATAFFHRAFGQEANFPLDTGDALFETQIKVPRDLSIKKHPRRYFCAGCGTTYSDKIMPNPTCTCCEQALQQVREVAICGGCGSLSDLPVPKVCLNPDCIQTARSLRDNSRFFESGFSRIGRVGRDADAHNDYFRFDALPLAQWRCRSCGWALNFHSWHELPAFVRHQVADAPFPRGRQATAISLAHAFLHQPEALCHSKEYERRGYHRPRYFCAECKHQGTYRKIHVVNIPSSRAVLHSYIVEGKPVADNVASPPEGNFVVGRFVQVGVLSLARERVRRFHSYRLRESAIIGEPIFMDNPNHYWADVHQTHAALLTFGSSLDHFVAQGSSHLCFQEGGACGCDGERELSQPESAGESERKVKTSREEAFDNFTRPLPRLSSWEVGRRPDPRRRWCDVVLSDDVATLRQKPPGLVCPGERFPCDRCSFFDKNRYRRYLILHTLKHAILAAVPRYTGAGRGQLQGILDPNDEGRYDLAILDVSEGGSGCLWLMRNHWESIWALTGEILEAAQQNRGALLLPFGCSRFNLDLCPSLALKYLRFARGES
jgi:hypothetical protein